ncbi:MAG TPA: hypothetical protein PLS73_07035 [Saprospiraceae bacterium]|nr:hypothetical protein [Saprospiraceae bacterium]
MKSDKESTKFPLLEFGIGLGLILSCIWLIHDYTAFFVSILIPSLAAIIMSISFIAELLEKSNLPDWYYRLLWMLVIIPILLLLIFGRLNHFEFDWTRLN